MPKSAKVLYHTFDLTLEDIVKEASKIFKKFTQDQDSEALRVVIEKINSAVMRARQNIEGPSTENLLLNKYDLAHCLRKYASVIIRDNNDNSRYSAAKKILEEALELFNSRENKDEIIKAEIQRTLHQLRKIAYELKDGDLLEKTVVELRKYLGNIDNYTLDCYESLYHIAFAKKDFDQAYDYTNKALSCCLSMNKSYLYENGFFQPINEAREESTHYRHRAKIGLAQLEGMKISEQKGMFSLCEEDFWKAYDADKNSIKIALGLKGRDRTSALDAGYQKLLTDLVVLFSLRCKKTLLEIDTRMTPMEYILKQSSIVFRHSKSSQERLESILNDKIAFIVQNNYLPLDYQYFESYPPPSIAISPEQVEKLFPERTNHNTINTDLNRLSINQ